MFELPEAVVLAGQISSTLAGKQVHSAQANQSPHKFAWYTGNPADYDQRLAGKVILKAHPVAGMVEIQVDDMLLAISTPIFFHAAGEKRPKKHQLLLEFSDETAVSCTVQMWGGLFCFPVGEKGGFSDYELGKQKPSPLEPAFDWDYFKTLQDGETPKKSAKEFLATKQRVPGLGNGVLQDILWTARIHPRRKMQTLEESQLVAMFHAVKSVLHQMTMQGGRDTERDLFGCPGGYRAILSKNTAGQPCPACGATIVKEAFMGGSIYYCPTCQPIG